MFAKLDISIQDSFWSLNEWTRTRHKVSNDTFDSPWSLRRDMQFIDDRAGKDAPTWPKPGRMDLPIDGRWESEDQYVQSLLFFANDCDIFRNLCGGIHILDFLTREPDLYTTVLPQDWRDWFDGVSVEDVLDLLLRRPLNEMTSGEAQSASRGILHAPLSLVEYVRTIRKHCLTRDCQPLRDEAISMPRHISVGMKPKKIHEVSNFAAYVDKLSTGLSRSAADELAIVDFGSGQNYLGRTLVSPPYARDVIAIERKHHHIDGAKGMDVHAKLTAKDKIMRNKKEYKRQLAMLADVELEDKPFELDRKPTDSTTNSVPQVSVSPHPVVTKQQHGQASMTYVEHDITNGDLESILYPVRCSDESIHSSGSDESDSMTCKTIDASTEQAEQRKLMVVSLHSCGNLIHHGLRSLILNPSVSAVAMIGCCYNLMTERLGPATYKLPTLRPNHPRLEATSSAYDPHGFPMSKTLEDFEHKHGRGVRLNITARMMAVQAPHNWGPVDSEAFFRRHFYRALLQRILLDRDVVKQCNDPDSLVGGSVSGKDDSGTPLIVGSLRKSCFTSFKSYVAGALEKLVQDPTDGEMIRRKTKDITDEVVEQYEAEWGYAKKNLSIIWSLMAFSAGVVESIIAVDRWLFLKEQECVERCWVESVFDYKLSPRNLVVVGIKKPRNGEDVPAVHNHQNSSTSASRESGHLVC